MPVSLEWSDGDAMLAWLTAPVLPRLNADAPAPEDIAQAISLDVSDIDVGAPGPAVLSAGNPFLFVPLRGTEALARARVDPVGWRSLMDELPANGLYMFCLIGPSGSRHLRARLFAPGSGHPRGPSHRLGGGGSPSRPCAAVRAAGRHNPMDNRTRNRDGSTERADDRGHGEERGNRDRSSRWESGHRVRRDDGCARWRN